jgi:hypothetical protein
MALLDTAANQVLIEDPTRFYDRSSDWVQLRMKTGKVAVAGIKGFGRLWRLTAEIDNRTAHGMRFRVYVDGETSSSTDRSFSEAEVLAAGTQNAALEVHVVKQKGSFYEIEINDTAPATLGTGEGFRIVGLGAAIGVKPTQTKALAAGSRK